MKAFIESLDTSFTLIIGGIVFFFVFLKPVFIAGDWLQSRISKWVSDGLPMNELVFVLAHLAVFLLFSFPVLLVLGLCLKALVYSL